MDVSEITRFKPDTMLKPAMVQEEVEQDDDSFESQAARRRLARKRAKEIAARAEYDRIEEERNRGAKQPRTEEERLQAEYQEQLDKMMDSEEAETLDETGVKKIILAFEKKALKNQETRIKFPDNPEKFMESEMELHDALQEMKNLATVPDYYPIIVDLNCVPSMLGLLTHDNTDIAVAILDLIQELTDVDTMNESEEGADSLIQALVDNQVFALMIASFDRLNEAVKEEADGVHNAMSIVENIVEVRPSVAKDVAEAGFMNWLIKKLKEKVAFDANKLYASEILSILLQNEVANRRMFGEMGAIDSLLQQLAYYKRHDPNQQEEFELMENLFNCMCSLLAEKENRDRFLQGEGLQLMNLMLREKKKSRSGALRVLDHALSGSDGVQNCCKFVDILGLRTIFPLYMKTPKKTKRAGVSIDEHEEHVVSIIASLFKNCTAGNGALKQRERLLAKFTENDHEKVDRLMEMHQKYSAKVDLADTRIEKERRTLGDELSDDEIYIRRLQEGLFVLQFVDYIILEICACGASTVKQRVLQMLNLRGGSLKTVRDVVREYAGNLGESAEDGNEEESSQNNEKLLEQEYLHSLIDKF
eukprot:TRINITY_DN4689_c0_g1_i2.p1 TRINITY_DN4689_c0_g1~~TRINITY_DN4689_c0_g1_i2.p1  ORF type:complete len:590 (-),score=161.14 TRINITY_DN4689_c0_g1_i2:233-2002(-)